MNTQCILGFMLRGILKGTKTQGSLNGQKTDRGRSICKQDFRGKNKSLKFGRLSIRGTGKKPKVYKAVQSYTRKHKERAARRTVGKRNTKEHHNLAIT